MMWVYALLTAYYVCDLASHETEDIVDILFDNLFLLIFVGWFLGLVTLVRDIRWLIRQFLP